MAKQTKMTEARIREAWSVLRRYKSGKAQLEARLVEVEQWWKLRHWGWMQEQGARGDMKTASAWLFNVIVSKHADGIQTLPEASVLPREEGDRDAAKSLSAILPCVLEENGFEEVYSDVLWQKLKGGTGAYGIYWDKEKLGGMGDIAIRRVNLLHLFWEPGIDDIQDSRNVFHVEAVDRDVLEERYPQLRGKVLSKAMALRTFMTEDADHEVNKVYVVDWYYRRRVGARTVLHYCKFVGESVLYATEDDPLLRARGLYDHGRYPFVFDVLFPMEGSPCGFGYVDVCKGAQEQIDILNQALVRSAMISAAPRYFARADGSINEAEFMDFTKPIVHVTGVMGSDSLMPIACPAVDGNVIAVINNKIAELKETSGNTDSANGITVSGSQPASAIAALQEASGKLSRASTLGAYRAFCRIVEMCIELIRQFYDLPRRFRITGELGGDDYLTFDNSALQPRPSVGGGGLETGDRAPVFDVKVGAQMRSAYSKQGQNDLAITLYQLGAFNPELADQALMLLDVMDFDDRDRLRQKVAQNGTALKKMAMYQQIAIRLAQQIDPALAESLARGVLDGTGNAIAGGDLRSLVTDAGGAMRKLEDARTRAQNEPVPGLGKGEEDKG